jgi:hypothetical protein
MEINIHSREQEFYRFSSDDFALIEIGIGSYTISSLKNFLESKNGVMSPDLAEFFRGESAASLTNKLLGTQYQGSMTIGEFDISTKKYIPKTGFSSIVDLDTTKYPPTKFTKPSTNIRTFLEEWNKVQRGIITNKTTVDGYRAAVYKIQNSASGCITFTSDIKILGQSRKSVIKLHLLESLDAEASRSISFKGSPIVTDVPQRPYGSKFGYRNTVFGDTGAYFSPSQDGADNPENTVSAPIDMAFDPSTGKYQAGTQQMLMRLLDDIDAAVIPDLDGEELLAATRQEYYEDGDDSPFRIKHAKARAIPFSSENGNVHLFGPDYKDGCEGRNQAIVQVINRLNIAYKAGSVVVCSKLVGDSGLWTIISGVGKEGGEAERKTLFGNFEYQQHLIPANVYFTSPQQAGDLTPSAWANKIRLSYYIKLLSGANAEVKGGLDEQSFKDIVYLNLAASELSDSEEDPVASLKELFPTVSEKIADFRDQSRIDGVDALDFINRYYCGGFGSTYEVFMPPDEYKADAALPKNITRQSSRIIPGLVLNNSNFEGNLGPLEVPIFWGMLFPDGYKIETARRFRDKIKTIDIYKDDPNLSELTCGATECVFDFNDQIKNLRFATTLGLNSIPITEDTDAENEGSDTEGERIASALSFVRRTGGLYRVLSFLQNRINDPNQLLRYVNLAISDYEAPRIPGSHIYGLEPVNPGRIQFSSMTIEALYSASNIVSDDSSFRHLKYYIPLLKELKASFPSGGSSMNYQEYAKFLIWGLNPNPSFTSTNPVDAGNTYNIPGLAISSAFSSEAIKNRHPAPVGSLMGSNVSIAPIISSSDSTGRVPSMPVLTCKTTLTTNASSLLFTASQLIGAIKKRTVSGGQGPSVTLFPIGGGIGWSSPGTDPKTWGFAQWGGDNEIDSYGTTALHARVFEHVPPNRLIYIGPIFTPLHFNASEPFYKYRLDTDANGNPVAIMTEEENTLSTDFKVPTFKNQDGSRGAVIPADASVTEQNLANSSDWVVNTVRRGKLLTAGGFAYFKPVIVIKTAVIEEGGSGYQKGDKIVFSDGSEFVVQETITKNNDSDPFDDDPGEEIKGIIPIGGTGFSANFSGKLTKRSTSGLTSLNPSYSGGSGSGAKFKFTFTVKYDIGYDPAPKESGPSNGTRLTTINNNGESEVIYNTVETTIDLVKTGSNKKFDVFYYYHNDPSHYTLDEFLVFNRPEAQHVICEVKGQ